MSIRENIELYGFVDIDEYSRILTEELAAATHPAQANAYMLEGMPFYAPRQANGHISILGFNNLPLPDSLLGALIRHPELFSDDLLVRWTQEQELIVENTLGQLRMEYKGK